MVSPRGASRALLVLAEASEITIVVSEQVVTETERAVARKATRALPLVRETLRHTGLRIVRDPGPEDLLPHSEIIRHRPDVAIVVAAMLADADYLVTLNRRHFLDDPGVAARSGLRIGMPGDALAWVRGRLARPESG